MPRIKPYQGTSHERLSRLIRTEQTPHLPSAVTFAFGEPVDGQSPEVGSTEIEVIAAADTREDPAVTVSYRRLSVDALKRLPPGELVPFQNMRFPTTMHAILPKVNQALGLDLIAAEVEDTPIASIPPDGLTIRITPASLAWIAGDYFFPYAPGASEAVSRTLTGSIPTDDRGRIRMREPVLRST